MITSKAPKQFTTPSGETFTLKKGIPIRERGPSKLESNFPRLSFDWCSLDNDASKAIVEKDIASEMMQQKRARVLLDKHPIYRMIWDSITKPLR